MDPSLSVIYNRLERSSTILSALKRLICFGRVSSNQNSFEITLQKVKSAVVLAYYMYSLHRYVKILLEPKETTANLVHNSVIFIFYCYIPIFEWAEIRIGGSWTKQFITAYSLVKTARASIDSGLIKLIHRCEIAWKLVSASFVCNAVIFSFHAIVFRQTAVSMVPMFESLLSLVPFTFQPVAGIPTLRWWILNGVSLIAHLWITANLASQCSVICFTLLTTLPITHALIQTMRGHVQKNTSVYRGTSILMDTISDYYGSTIGLVQGHVMMSSIVAVYCVTRVRGITGAAIGSAGLGNFLILLLILQLMSKGHESSKKLLQEWRASAGRGRGTSRYDALVLRTLRPLMFRVAGLYFLDSFIVFTMCSKILEGSVNVLVATSV